MAEGHTKKESTEFSREEQVALLKRSVEEWNVWRAANMEMVPDLRGADLWGAQLSGADLRTVDLRGAHLGQANLDGADLEAADLSGASLPYALLRESRLSIANLRGADLRQAKLYSGYLVGANLNKADLRQASLVEANLVGVNLNDADLRDADLALACLVRTRLNHAKLTGANLYGTARDDWEIERADCACVFSDDDEVRRRFPPDRDFEPGEFEALYRSLPTIEYVFEHGMTPLDPVVMDRVVQAIRDRTPEFDIRIDSINARGLAPSIKFTVCHEEHKEPALLEVTKEYGRVHSRLEELERRQASSEQREHLIYGMFKEIMGHALEACGPTISFGAGSTAQIAFDGGTITNTQYVQHVESLRKAIEETQPEPESKAAQAKGKLLDVLGGAAEDIAKEKVKEVAKQIVELGKELGPVIVQSAAYAFFRGLLPS